MNTIFLYIKKHVALLFVIMLLCSCKTPENRISDPVIMEGVAKLTVRFNHGNSKDHAEISNVCLSLSPPVIGEEFKFEALKNETDTWFFDIPVECDVSIGGVNFVINNDNHTICAGLKVNKEVVLNVYLEGTVIVKLQADPEFDFTSDDMINTYKSLVSFMEYGYKHQPTYEMTQEEFLEHELKILKERSAYSLKDLNLSDKARNFLQNDFNLLYLKGRLLTYKEAMQVSYLNLHDDEYDENLILPDFSMSYYGFLSYFDLNNPKYLINFSYKDAIQGILADTVFKIPRVGEIPITEWLKGVQTIMSDLVGFDNGQLYDLMASNSYAMQFKNELRPLSEKQITNIKDYFKGGEIEKILLRRDEEIKKLDAEKSKLVINETPDVEKEKLMDAIIARYPGKVVVVDFWATWCAPCINAMKTIHPLKFELKEKNVVFVYLTDGSSPKELWNEKIKGIGSEHYYLNNEQFQYLMKGFDFEYIPSYVIYDAKRTLKHKFGGSYPGNDAMRKMIKELLYEN